MSEPTVIHSTMSVPEQEMGQLQEKGRLHSSPPKRIVGAEHESTNIGLRREPPSPARRQAQLKMQSASVLENSEQVEEELDATEQFAMALQKLATARTTKEKNAQQQEALEKLERLAHAVERREAQGAAHREVAKEARAERQESQHVMNRAQADSQTATRDEATASTKTGAVREAARDQMQAQGADTTEDGEDASVPKAVRLPLSSRQPFEEVAKYLEQREVKLTERLDALHSQLSQTLRPAGATQAGSSNGSATASASPDVSQDHAMALDMSTVTHTEKQAIGAMHNLVDKVASRPRAFAESEELGKLSHEIQESINGLRAGKEALRTINERHKTPRKARTEVRYGRDDEPPPSAKEAEALAGREADLLRAQGKNGQEPPAPQVVAQLLS